MRASTLASAAVTAFVTSRCEECRRCGWNVRLPFLFPVYPQSVRMRSPREQETGMFKRAAAAFAFAAISLLASAMPAPGSSTFHFGAASYNTKEGNGTVTISVIREGNLGTSASVSISRGTCCPDTAYYGSDYWYAGSQFNSFLE